MKKLFSLLTLLIALPAFALDVRFIFGDAAGQPGSVKTLTLYPLSVNVTNSAGAITLRDRITKVTSTSGSVTISNLIAGKYRSELAGNRDTTTNYYNFPSGVELVEASDWVTAPTNNAPFVFIKPIIKITADLTAITADLD